MERRPTELPVAECRRCHAPIFVVQFLRGICAMCGDIISEVRAGE